MFKKRFVIVATAAICLIAALFVFSACAETGPLPIEGMYWEYSHTEDINGNVTECVQGSEEDHPNAEVRAYTVALNGTEVVVTDENGDPVFDGAYTVNETDEARTTDYTIENGTMVSSISSVDGGNIAQLKVSNSSNTYVFTTFISTAYESDVNFDSVLGITICVGLILLGAMIVQNILLFIFAKDKMKASIFASIAVIFLYLIAAVIANVVTEVNTIDSDTGQNSFQDGNDGLIAENSDYPGIIAGVTIAIFVILLGLLLIDRKKVKARSHTQAIVYAALSVGLATGLSYIKLFDAPYGGSITLFSLLPIALYSYMFGIRRGTLAGFVFSLLQLLQNPWIVHPVQFLLDYIIPFSVVGTCGGLFKPLFERIQALSPAAKASLSLSCGIVLGVILRYIFHLISGAVYFGSYAAGYGIADEWLYSAVYNALYVFPDGAICVAGGLLLMLSASFRAQMDRVTNAFKKGNIKRGAKAMAALVTDGAVGGGLPAQEGSVSDTVNTVNDTINSVTHDSSNEGGADDTGKTE